MVEVKCEACEYEWVTKFEDRLPKQCPACKRYNKIKKKN